MRFLLMVLLWLSGLLCSGGFAARAAVNQHKGDAWKLRNGRLQASPDRHHLQHENGKPFLWIGDTAWELFHRLDRDQAELYLENRRSKGFTVIQAVLLAEMDGLNVPNAYGFTPLYDNDPGRPRVLAGSENDYWDHVDFIIEEAEDRGMVMALVPTWGEWVTPRFTDEPVFKTTEQGYRYGNFLGKRYRKQENLVWILGGDRKPTEMDHAFRVWRAMAEGIADGVNNTYRFDGKADYSTTLMSYHSMTSSALWWAEDPWIDFYMWGTYHGSKDWSRSFLIAREDWNRAFPKPTLNAEPCYEEMPRDYKGDNGYFNEIDVRNAAYWSLLSGSFGFTYGAHPVWQMWDGAPPKSTVKLPDLAPTRMPWLSAMDLIGATEMYYLRKLLLARPFEQLRPDQNLLMNPAPAEDPDPANHIVAARGNRFALFYSPHGRPIHMRSDALTTNRVNAYWYDPREGVFLEIGNLPHQEERHIDPPGEGPGNDWVLLIEDEAAGFRRPE